MQDDERGQQPLLASSDMPTKSSLCLDQTEIGALKGGERRARSTKSLTVRSDYRD